MLPCKLAHGHVSWLLKQGIKYIFYPCVPYERYETAEARNNYNCPIVTSYGENIKNNIDGLKDPDIIYQNPFISFENKKSLKNVCVNFLQKKTIFHIMK